MWPSRVLGHRPVRHTRSHTAERRPRQDSNLRTRLRRPMLYPLSYEGGGWRIPGRKPLTRADGWGRAGAFGPFAACARRWRALRARSGRAEVGVRRVRCCVLEPRSGGELGAASLVAVEREPVDHEGVAEEVEELAGVADAVGSSEPEGVFEVAVDRLGVVAAGKSRAKSGSDGRDGPDVLGPVELAGRVVGVAVEPDGDGLVPYRSGSR